MNLFSLFAGIVLAAESVISPIPENTPVVVPEPPKPDVSFGEIVAIPTPSLTPAATASATPTPTLVTRHYTVAFLGDSMIDTMGPGLPSVQSKLGNNFTLLNYGVGATNIDYGIQRITNAYDYLGKHIESLASTRPDIVVLESFAYNPFPDADGGINRHWLALAKAVDTLRSAIPGVKIIIAATIAPRVSDVMSASHVALIQSYLESTIAFAKSERLPLVDAYHGSVESYTNPGDHIHYSDSGRAYFAGKLAATIQSVL